MRSFHHWTRDLHLYVGLFVSPLVLVFAVSSVVLNHPGILRPAAGAHWAGVGGAAHVDLPAGEITLEQARAILRQLNVTGEIDYLRHSSGEAHLVIPVTKPGETARIDVDLQRGTARVDRQYQGLAGALVYLHKMPGPHNASFRGNWIYTLWWAFTADGFVLAVLFLTLSGMYLWWKLRTERRIGWVLLAAGATSVTVLAVVLSAG